MTQYNNPSIQLIQPDTDEVIRISACMADTILKPLYDYVNSYLNALDIICHWTKEFYEQYYSKLKNWESFEESEDNIFNSVCWDDFLIDWVSDRFKKFKFQDQQILLSETKDRRFYGSSKTPRLIIALKHHTLAKVYSNIPVVYAYIDYDNPEFASCRLVGVFKPDTIASDLITLFETNAPQQRAIQEELISCGF